MQNYKKIYAMKKSNEKRIKSLFNDIEDKSGIYLFYRIDENQVKHAYVGQATKSVLSRCAEHLSGYQYIDISIKKHKLFNADNPFGWKLKILKYDDDKNVLNTLEQEYILEYAKNGYQLKNKTSGSQGVGKEKIGEYRTSKGYRDGVNQGEENARKFIANLFEKHLTYQVKKEGNKNQEKALLKLEEFLKKPIGCEVDNG